MLNGRYIHVSFQNPHIYKFLFSKGSIIMKTRTISKCVESSANMNKVFLNSVYATEVDKTVVLSIGNLQKKIKQKTKKHKNCLLIHIKLKKKFLRKENLYMEEETTYRDNKSQM